LTKNILFINGINTIFGGAGKNSLALWESDLYLNRFKVEFFNTSQSNFRLTNNHINFLKHIPGVFFRIFTKIPLFEYLYKISIVHVVLYIYLQFKKKKDLILLSHHSTFYLLFFSYFNKPAVIIHDLIYLKARNQKNSRFFCKLTFKFESLILKKATFILVQSYREKRILDYFFKGTVKVYLIKSTSSEFLKTDFKKQDNTIALVADWRRIENIHGVRSFFNKSDYRHYAKENVQINVWGYGSFSVCKYLKKALIGQSFIVSDRGVFQNLNEISDKFLLVPIYHGSGIKVKVIEALFNRMIIITTPKGIEGLFRIKSKIINIVNSFRHFSEILPTLCRDNYETSHFIHFKKKYDKHFCDISSVLMKHENKF
jgi:hypothetical protein